MSAFLVNEQTIQAIAQFGARAQYGTCPSFYWQGTRYEIENPTQIGQILWSENNRSVNYRYDEQTPDPVYQHKHLARPVPALHIIKLCDCLDYQSCETEDWKDTQAYAILQAIRERAIGELPGYDEAPWGY